MSDDDLDAPPTPEEEAAARRLAEALEGHAAGAEPELAAARLLQALGAADRRDELAERRLRLELVREASHGRHMTRVRALAAASVILAGGAATYLATRHRLPHDSAALASREAEARAAVARLMESDQNAGQRLGSLTDDMRETRLEKLWLARYEHTLATSGTSTMASPSPTPGGPTS